MGNFNAKEWNSEKWVKDLADWVETIKRDLGDLREHITEALALGDNPPSRSYAAITTMKMQIRGLADTVTHDVAECVRNEKRSREIKEAWSDRQGPLAPNYAFRTF